MKAKIRSAAALVLALVMVFSLAACGKSSGNDNSPTSTESPGEAGKSDVNAPEYVYSANFKALNSISPDGFLTPLLFTDDGLYASCYEKVGENIPDGAVPEYEGQYDLRESRLYFVGFDGSAAKLENYVPIPAPENSSGYAGYSSSSSLNGLALDSDGTLSAIESVYSSWYDGPEGIDQSSDEYWNHFQYNQQYYIRKLDKDGAELSCTELPVAQDSYINAYNMLPDEAGNLLLTSDTSIRAIAPDGSDAYVIQTDNYIDNLIRLKDGRVGALIWGENGTCLYIVDTQNKRLGEMTELPNDAYQFVSGGGNYDLYYTSGINFYGYDLETKQADKLLNWINCDVNDNDLNCTSVSSDGKICSILSHWNDKDQTSTNELAILSRVPYDSVPHKETLTLAVMGLDMNVRSAVIAFNRSSDKYRIEINDYSEYNTEDNYEAGLTKLTTEIMAGNMPDIISLDQLPYTQLASKGLLEDMYPYLDSDSELSREDFFPNVLSALEVNGGLYAVCPAFQLSTVVGASSVVGDAPGWNYQQFNDALASMPEGCAAFDAYTSRENILQTCLFLDMDNYVDWTTGQCRFDSQEFIDLLNFAALFPADADIADYEWTEGDDPATQIAQGKQMLMQVLVSSVSDIQYNDLYFGGSAAYIGYPTNSGGTGSAIRLFSDYAMSSSCPNKEAAWEFLRSFLTEDYQESCWGLPTNISAYKATLKRAMTPEYMKDADGNYLLDENGEKIEISTGGIGLADGTTYDIYAVTQEQADKLWNAITSTTKLMDSNDSILDIVNEQAQAFFVGQKSAEEVAQLIQSKANIYVNEQR